MCLGPSYAVHCLEINSQSIWCTATMDDYENSGSEDEMLPLNLLIPRHSVSSGAQPRMPPHTIPSLIDNLSIFDFETLPTHEKSGASITPYESVEFAYHDMDVKA